MTLKKIVPALIAVALSTNPASAAPAANCTPPSWYGDAITGRMSYEWIGIGKNAALDVARKDARREIGRKLGQRYAAEILHRADVRKGVNQTVYTKAELVAAVALALSAHVRTLERIKAETVCNVSYVALGTSTTNALAEIKAAGDLSSAINHALVGKIDDYEAKLKPATPAAASTSGTANAEATRTRLEEAVQGLDKSVFFQLLLETPLRSRIASLKNEVQKYQAVKWDEDKPAAQEKLDAAVRAHERFLTAVRDYVDESYVSAYEVFRALAEDGDQYAQVSAALMIADAKGTRRDPAEALKLLKRAATQGHGPAKMIIGTYYLSGYGTKRDVEEATKWLNAGTNEGWGCTMEIKQCRKTGL